jgi:NADH:ubiquinone oxidoreductase subunit 2 (subunit N)
MTHGAASGLVLLACAALGMMLWARLGLRSRAGRAPYMALAVVCVAGAGGGAPLWTATSAMPGLALVRYDALMTLVFLGMLLLGWLGQLAHSDANEPRAWAALSLFQAAGGLLALSSRDLLSVASGILLFYVAGLVRGEEGHSSLALAILALPCLALVYVGQGSLDLPTVSADLWRRGGPAPLFTYLGLGLFVACLLGQLWLAVGRVLRWSQAELALLCALVLRLRLFAAGAWVYEWRWGLMAAALPFIIYGAWQGWRARGTDRGLVALAYMQGGFVLASIAVGDVAAGLLAAILGIGALALGYSTLAATLRIWNALDGQRSGQVPVGLARQRPWLGVPMLLGLLSLAGFAPLPGFWARYGWIVAQKQSLSAAWGWGSLALCLMGASIYVPWVVALLRRSEPLPDGWPDRKADLLVCISAGTLILLGLWAPFGPRLIAWLIA